MKKPNILFQGYPFPKNQTQEILLILITQGYASFFDVPYMQDFRKKISILKLDFGLDFERIQDSRTNKFGRPYNYIIHKLSPSGKEKAVEVYLKMCS